ncbi:MAG: copper chaperone PCu(A)C [Rhodobacter sp.]|nr:copper chaperone PCu(A)C [Paracoccaceae bacterium]MCB1410282.1 copper chaperone PCu(A)C [Paracoccaceae bacterium]MCC0081312.1 copper chaperone PCu(A)C [Rhodobacter sp.]
MIRTISLAAFAASLAMPALACDGFSVHDAYARSSTPMSPSGAAFMVMHNEGTTDCRVVGARSDIAERTELHTHISDANGVMQMRQVDGFDVPAGGDHALQRGGDHVMFMGLHAAMEQGAEFPVTLVFADGSEFVATVTVDNERQPMQGMGMQHGQQMHGQMHGQSDN